MGQSIHSLPPSRRCQRYREMADAALLESQQAKTSQQRAEYLTMAAGWLALAQDLELDPRRLTQLEESQQRLPNESDRRSVDIDQEILARVRAAQVWDKTTKLEDFQIRAGDNGYVLVNIKTGRAQLIYDDDSELHDLEQLFPCGWKQVA